MNEVFWNKTPNVRLSKKVENDSRCVSCGGSSQSERPKCFRKETSNEHNENRLRLADMVSLQSKRTVIIKVQCKNIDKEGEYDTIHKRI